MYSIRKSFRVLVIALGVVGIFFQMGGCDLGSLATSAVSSINPCGTILNCDPSLYQFVTSGIEGPGVRPDIDPFCTFAPWCNLSQDPLFGFGP
jgi:hypothetical protein